VCKLEALFKQGPNVPILHAVKDKLCPIGSYQIGKGLPLFKGVRGRQVLELEALGAQTLNPSPMSSRHLVLKRALLAAAVLCECAWGRPDWCRFEGDLPGADRTRGRQDVRRRLLSELRGPGGARQDLGFWKILRTWPNAAPDTPDCGALLV
jgi:hypothetical protein